MSDAELPSMVTVAEDLADIVGSENVITEPDLRESYGRDKSPFPELVPSIVVRPGDVDEIAAIVTLANRHRLAIVPRGGGFSLGGFPPVSPSQAVFLDLRRLNRIIEIDEVNMTVRAEAGVLAYDLDAEVAARGFQVFTVAVPIRYVTLGGALSGVFGGGIAHGACTKGANVEHLLGLRVVLGDGTVVDTNAGGANRHRNASVMTDGDGPFMTPMFVADGGSLGVKVEATLRIIPAPRCVHVDSWVLPDLESVLEVMLAMSHIRDAPYSFMTATEEEPWSLDVIATGETGELLAGDVATLENVIRAHRGEKGTVERREAAHEIYKPGGEWADAFVALDRGLVAFVFSNRDFADGFRRVRALVDTRFAERDLASRGMRLRVLVSPLTRHAIYATVSIIYDPGTTDGRDEAARLTREAYELVSELGGYAEPHQGEIARIMATSWTPEYRRLVSAVKAAIDPNNVLNPGLWERDARRQ